MFAHRGEFSDSFDFVTASNGEIVGAMRPEEDARSLSGTGSERGEVLRFRHLQVGKKIGSPICKADTSYLHNDETIIQKGQGSSRRPTTTGDSR